MDARQLPRQLHEEHLGGRRFASRNGKFSFTGKLTDVTKKQYVFTLKGHFVTPRLAVGVINATGSGKTCKPVNFKAKFTGTGPFSF